jgi:HlyD family secretion protein
MKQAVSRRPDRNPRVRVRAIAEALVKIVRAPRSAGPSFTALVAWVRQDRRVVLAGLGSLLGAFALANPFLRGPDRALVAAVQQGPFEVTIVEAGVLQALHSVTYSTSIPGGQVTILFLAPEGAAVHEGDLLVRLDSTPYRESLELSQAQLAQARSELVKAQQEGKLLELQGRRAAAKAEQDVGLAVLELAGVTEGSGKVAAAESEAELVRARWHAEETVSAYEDLKPLMDEGFVTEREFVEARLAVDKAREELELLELKHRAYVEYSRPAEIEKARGHLQQSKLVDQRLRNAVGDMLGKAEFDLRLARKRVADLTDNIELQKQSIARCEIRATRPGLVIHEYVPSGSAKRKLQVGDQVSPNQELVTVPDLSQMIVDAHLRESDIHKIKKGQDVSVVVRAYPDLRLAGEVSSIGALTQEEEDGRSGKYFQVAILLSRTDPRLRPGMTARVKLPVERLDEAVYVPLDAVFARRGRQYCYVWHRRQPELREVVTGPSNETAIVIVAGVTAGEKVLVRDPDDGIGSRDEGNFSDGSM